MLALSLLIACNPFAPEPTPFQIDPATAAPDEPLDTPGTATPAPSNTHIGRDEAGNRGVRVAGENGVLVGDHEEVGGVRVGGEYGVMAGKDEESAGVRVGGSKGVVIGKDDETSGVRIGGKKGVEVDTKKGVRIGGKKLFGK